MSNVGCPTNQPTNVQDVELQSLLAECLRAGGIVKVDIPTTGNLIRLVRRQHEQLDRISKSGAPCDIGKRLADCATRLEEVDTLPKPYDLYYAIKNDGEGTGWSYAVAGIGAADIRAASNEVFHLRLEVARRFTVDECNAIVARKTAELQEAVDARSKLRGR